MKRFLLEKTCCRAASPAGVLVVCWALPVRRCSASRLPSGALAGRPSFPLPAATGHRLLTAPAARAASSAPAPRPPSGGSEYAAVSKGAVSKGVTKRFCGEGGGGGSSPGGGRHCFDGHQGFPAPPGGAGGDLRDTTTTDFWQTHRPTNVPPLRGATIDQVWTRHCRSSRACPTAFIALSVHHVFIRPLALLVFQTVPGPCLPGWGKSCGSPDLGFTAWAHYSLSPGCGVYVVFHVWVAFTLAVGGGGGGLLDTHPPNYHRQKALTSACGADPKSPTMAYPTERGGGGGRVETHPCSPPP